MNIVPIKQLNRAMVNQFFTNHWGSPQMVVSTGIYNCSELDGFAAVENGQRIIGLITFVIRGNECEIISLDSIMENRGVGSTLLHEAETWARQQRCTAVQLITTNDNLHALRFYQKRGYQIVNVFPNAVDKARRIKPSIPKTSPDGIPIRDELLLVKPLA